MAPVHTPRIVVRDEDRWRAAMARARAGALLSPGDLQAIFQIKRTQFARLARAGAWDPFRVEFAIGRFIYSGAKVARYLDGESVFAHEHGGAH